MKVKKSLAAGLLGLASSATVSAAVAESPGIPARMSVTAIANEAGSVVQVDDVTLVQTEGAEAIRR